MGLWQPTCFWTHPAIPYCSFLRFVWAFRWATAGALGGPHTAASTISRGGSLRLGRWIRLVKSHTVLVWRRLEPRTECHPECHLECWDQLYMVRSHTVMVWSYLEPHRSLLVGGGRPSLVWAPGLKSKSQSQSKKPERACESLRVWEPERERERESEPERDLSLSLTNQKFNLSGSCSGFRAHWHGLIMLRLPELRSCVRAMSR